MQTQIMMSPYSSGRDPRHFSDADKFEPDRWLRSTNAGHSYAMLPFGSGKRYGTIRYFCE